MDETKLKGLLTIMLIVFLVLGAISAILSIIDCLTSEASVKTCEKDFKAEYEKYKSYLLDESELHLQQPKRLKIQIYSATFTNNSELRHSFIQVAQTLRTLNNIAEKVIDPEIETIFRKIRQVAYSNDEEIRTEKL